MVCDEKTGEFIAMTSDIRLIEIKEEIEEESTKIEMKKNPKRSLRK
jgi:hypothetical protein